jgi:hypothetical protein
MSRINWSKIQIMFWGSAGAQGAREITKKHIFINNFMSISWGPG